MSERSDHVPGYAVGGLSGGEAKDEVGTSPRLVLTTFKPYVQFWKVVSLCTSVLPENKPRYCM